MTNRPGLFTNQGFVFYFALLSLLGLLPIGCQTAEPIVLEKQKAFLSDTFTAFKKSIEQDGSIPLDRIGNPDLERLGVSLPSVVNASTVFWRRNLGANDIELEEGEYVIGMIASDIDEDLGFHIYLLYSNGMIVSSGTSKQGVDQRAEKLKQQIAF